MKKFNVFVVLVMVVIGSCAAQNSNYSQRIVGTWTDHYGINWVFGSDGKVTISGTVYYYGVTDTKLALCDSDYGNDRAYLSTYTISISADGKTLILGDRTGSHFQSTYWLKKQ